MIRYIGSIEYLSHIKPPYIKLNLNIDVESNVIGARIDPGSASNFIELDPDLRRTEQALTCTFVLKETAMLVLSEVQGGRHRIHVIVSCQTVCIHLPHDETPSP